ncbi:MAG: glycosyltransferase family 4 protein [Planctomycetota bacterium]|nr:glycosyltransferase family 4 protein [Planctomycetota bacterium]
MNARSEEQPKSVPEAHPIPDTLEPAVIDWYRGRFHGVSASRPDHPGLPAIEDDLERALVAGRRPAEHVRRGLQDIWCEAARTEVEGSTAGRPRAIRALRSLNRLLTGRRPYLHAAPDDETTGTRVLHAIADLQIGGAQQLVIDLARSAPPDPAHRVMARSIQRRFRPGVPSEEVPAQREDVNRAFDRFRPSVLHLCHYHASATTAAWYEMTCDAAFERGVPIVQSHCVIGEPLDHPGVRRLVFCSEWSRVRSGLAGIPDVVINPGTPIDRFLAPRRDPSDTPVVGMVYRLDGDKIDASAATVIRRILERVPGSRFVVVGDGRMRPGLQRELQEAGFADRVRWIGNVAFDRLPGLHRSFDVEIAPVIADTFGSGSVHAISAGTPVVGYGVAAIPSILRHEASIARPGSPEELAERVARLVEDPGLHAEVHATQLAHARGNFDLRTMNRRYHRLFAETASSP